MSARERLCQLVDLASAGGPDERRRLAAELTDILLAWPADYPAQMRLSFGLLLQKISVELDGETRRDIAGRLAADRSVPLALLNELYFDATQDARKAILARNAQTPLPNEDGYPCVDEAALMGAVRTSAHGAFAPALARFLDVPDEVASRCVADASGEGLALLCRGAHLSRLAFSTIVMLTDASLVSAQRKLEAYDRTSAEVAARMVQFWRAQHKARISRFDAA